MTFICLVNFKRLLSWHHMVSSSTFLLQALPPLWRINPLTGGVICTFYDSVVIVFGNTASTGCMMGRGG